jgi:hypothetical protein
LYEYFRARRPLLAFTDPAGDTSAVLRSSGFNAIVPLDDAAQIGRLITRFVNGDRDGMQPFESAIAASSRASRAEQLARLLDELAFTTDRKARR